MSEPVLLFCINIQRTWKTSDTSERKEMDTKLPCNTSQLPHMMSGMKLKLDVTKGRIATVYAHGGIERS